MERILGSDIVCGSHGSSHPGVHLQCHRDLSPVLPPRGELRENSGRTQGEQGPLKNLKVTDIFQRKGTTGTGQRGTKVKVGKVYRSDTQATCFTQLICAYSNCLSCCAAQGRWCQLSRPRLSAGTSERPRMLRLHKNIL